MLSSWVLLCGLMGAGVLSYFGVGCVRRYAVRWHVMDMPIDRSSHSVPVPIGGGIVLIALNAVGWAAFAHLQSIISWPHVLAFAAGALIIGVVSFVDDIGHVPYPLRFLAQGIGAAVFMAGFASWQTVNLPLIGSVVLGGAGIILTLLWIVGLTNAFNFMDGSDGLAAGQAVSAGLGWTALGLLSGQRTLVGLGGLLAATSLGFLLHNWHPARIFMGDVGSTFLGFSFAALTVIATRDDPRLGLAGVLLVWPTIFDTLFTVIGRLRRHENVFAGHRQFLFHRLLHIGWQPQWIASLYMTFPILGGLLAFSWDHGTPVIHAGVGLALSCLCASFWLFVRREERTILTYERRKTVVAVAVDRRVPGRRLTVTRALQMPVLAIAMRADTRSPARTVSTSPAHTVLMTPMSAVSTRSGKE